VSERPADTDLDLLRTKAYAGPEKLEDRRALYDYQDPRPDFHAWTLDQIEWPATGRVLDLGCGPGTHLARLGDRRPHLRLVGADASVGMLAVARAGAPSASVMALDAAAIGLGSACVEVVMANHMLYHVSDLDRTLAEVRRVLVAGGTLLAVTNGLDHFVEFDALLGEAAGRRDFVRPSARFSLERSGADLARWFDHVERRDHVGELVVPDLEPLVRFATSMRDLTFVGFDDASWARTMVRFEQLVAERLERDGAIRITAHAGAFVCS
jgi:SAM-dependent methyltransferase